MLAAPELLVPGHIVDQFNCGQAQLDDWLKRRALANQSSGASRCYVVADECKKVVGYYAIASASLSAEDAGGKLRRNMPDPIPMALLGRLAVDVTAQSQGLGVALLQDAILRLRAAADILGIRGVMVHAISDKAKTFYERYGFKSTARNPMLLVRPL